MLAWIRLLAALIIVVGVGTWIVVAGPEPSLDTSPSERANRVSQPESAEQEQKSTTAETQQSVVEGQQAEQTSWTAPADEKSERSAAGKAEQTSVSSPQSEVEEQETAEPEPQWRRDDFDALMTLTVEPEGSASIVYDRDDYDIYSGRDENGCNTRDRVLMEEAVRVISVDDDCNIIGVWFSWLDGKTVSEAGELQIAHLVSLSEAHDSGAWRWDLERRKAFNNDLEHPETLSAVSKAVNRSKWAYDPSEWRPPLQSAWCRFARDWISVKLTWDLTADTDEVTALAEMLQTCAGPL